MKKVLFITSLIVMCQMGWAQKKTVETEEQYRLVRTTDLDKYYDGLLVTPFLCDYVALSNDPVEKTMTFDEINMFDYDLKDRQTVSTLYINMVKNALIKEKSATAIIACMHEVETLKNGSIKVTVRGIPVKYTNFRPAQKTDNWILEFYEKTDVPAKAGVTKTRVINNERIEVKE